MFPPAQKSAILPFFVGGLRSVDGALDFLVGTSWDPTEEALRCLHTVSGWLPAMRRACLPTGSKTVVQSFDLDISALLFMKRCATGGREALSDKLDAFGPLDSVESLQRRFVWMGGAVQRGEVSSSDNRISSMASGVPRAKGVNRTRRGEVVTLGIISADGMKIQTDQPV